MAENVCPVCGGTGWRIVERDGITGADRCDCAAEERARGLEAKANIPPLYQNASLDNFNALGDDRLRIVIGRIQAYVRDHPQPSQPGLLLIGDPGTGKTHLAVAALRLLIARGFEGLFFDYQNLIERIRSGWDATSGSSNREAYRSALDTEVLLLDDLGAHRTIDWIEDTFTSIITWRCNHQKPLIATTNLPDSGAGDNLVERTSSGVRYKTSLVERIGDRARSRLFEMCKVVRMPAVGDYRLKRATVR